MAAGDDLTGTVRVQALTIGDEKIELIGVRPYAGLGQSSPANQVYVNGGAPQGGGIPISSASRLVYPGERIVLQIKVTSAKTEDSDHANNDISIPVTVRDRNTGRQYPKVLRSTDRNTGKLADDPVLLTTQYVDMMHWECPANEEWDLGPGELHVRGATTA